MAVETELTRYSRLGRRMTYPAVLKCTANGATTAPTPGGGVRSLPPTQRAPHPRWPSRGYGSSNPGHDTWHAPDRPDPTDLRRGCEDARPDAGPRGRIGLAVPVLVSADRTKRCPVARRSNMSASRCSAQAAAAATLIATVPVRLTRQQPDARTSFREGINFRDRSSVRSNCHNRR